ncbi:MAG: F0F1 ATP synthase subunit epsilon [Bacteroidales bacterium]|nr:F0F1 ATP synthase subunit epsilon [Bacteroidales bacterium]
MRLNIITPEGTLVDQEVDRVELPGLMGRFVVLRNHAPLVSALTEGDIVFGEMAGPSAPLSDRQENSPESRIRISSGFVEVVDNHIIACVEV